MALKRTCAKCNVTINYSEGSYCEKCKEIVEQQQKERRSKYEKTDRYKENNGIYKTKQWKYVRQAVLQRDNHLCLCCLKLKKMEVATCVHHIVEIKIDKSKAYDKDNLIALCTECHELVHVHYKNDKDRGNMQEYLRGLIKEWE